jgi:hypothetical protein
LRCAREVRYGNGDRGSAPLFLPAFSSLAVELSFKAMTITISSDAVFRQERSSKLTNRGCGIVGGAVSQYSVHILCDDRDIQVLQSLTVQDSSRIDYEAIYDWLARSATNVSHDPPNPSLPALPNCVRSGNLIISATFGPAVNP